MRTQRLLLSVFTCFLTIIFIQGNAANYYQTYPIQVTMNGSGSSMYMQCAVYDVVQGQWQNYSTGTYSNLTYQNSDGVVMFAEAGTYATVGAITYDLETHQFSTHTWTGYDNVSFICKDGVAAFTEGGTYATIQCGIYNIVQNQWETQSFTGYDNVTLTNIDGIVAFAEGGTYATIQCATFNPETLNWTSQSFTGYDNVTLINKDGVVAFTEGGTYATVQCATYDAGLQQWKTTSFTGYDNVTLTNKNGVVAFAEGGTYATIYAATYDGWQKNWEYSSMSGYDNVTLLNDARIVAFAESGSSATVGCFGYDVQSHQWDLSAVSSSGVNSFAINDGTVTWLDDNFNGHNRGYTSGSWSNGYTTLNAKFYLENLNQPSLINLIHVRNYSTGTNNVTYDFDDGNTAQQKTLWHLYKVNGHYIVPQVNYNVCLNAVSSSGNQNTCETVSFVVSGIGENQNPLFQISEVAKNQFEITYSANLPFQINISNLTGQLIYKKQTQSVSTIIDMNAFSKGVYFLSLINNDAINFSTKLTVK